ncbi:hypothetical protein J1614_002270 [Plenodomus biglobosus]|nr:hypothetical protein J1614_002270 [Plenodomus biglobosus]
MLCMLPRHRRHRVQHLSTYLLSSTVVYSSYQEKSSAAVIEARGDKVYLHSSVVPFPFSMSPASAQKEAERKVRSWGFNHVFTWTDQPNAHYTPHKHSSKTTHLVLRGSLTYAYPNDADDDSEGAKEPAVSKTTIGPGARWDVDANRVHEVWVGEEGCVYVIGE